MFTLRFESDTRSSNGGGVSYVVEASSFRTRVEDNGSVSMTFPESDETHVIDGALGGYDRCFVMNATGATVAQYRPRPKKVCRSAGQQ